MVNLMKMKKEIRVKTLAQYINAISKIKTPPVDVGLTQKKLVYRGLSYRGYQLEPSILRYPSEYVMNSLQSKETELIEQAQLRFPSLFQEEKYPVLRLAKLQHYGIPTRLMDVTSNALVALYFACQNSKGHPDTDGEIVVFSDYVYSAFSPTINAIADTAILTYNSAYMFATTFYHRVQKQSYFSRHSYPNDEERLQKAAERFCTVTKAPLIVDAGNLTERQKNQQGKFIIFPNVSRKIENDLYITDELIKVDKDSDIVIKRIIIEKDYKTKILSQLSRFGITKDFLFADNVDTVNEVLVQQIKDLYTCEDW